MEKLSILLMFFLLCSCEPIVSNPGADTKVNGMKPIYATETMISMEGSRMINELGNLVLYNPYLFIVDNSAGIHIYNNSDPSNPSNLGFLAIPGVTQITIDEDILFANFGSDLIMIDITDINNPIVKDKVDNFYELEQHYPIQYEGSFECVDPSMGIVIRWEEAEIFDPQCWR